MTHPDLFALLRGELTNAEATAAGDHLEDCADCRGELAELAVGHALLARAVRTVAEPGGTPSAAGGTPSAALPPLPPLPPREPRTRRRMPALLVAAAAAIVAGVGGLAIGASVVDRSADEPAPDPAYASVTLDPVEGDADGTVQMVSTDERHTRMTIEAPDLPGARRGHFYYAWLLDPDTNKMLPLGQVGPDGTASFDLDDSLLDAYSAVDVSLEDDDGDPGHSVTSVLRGSYAGDSSTAS